MGELDAIKTLEQYLAPIPEWCDDGERGVCRSSNHQWRQTAIPIPDTQNNTDLQKAMKVVGSPPKPQPDLSFGYTQKTFTEKEVINMRSVLPLLVTNESPYFPYLVYEWKSEKNGGTMHVANRQAIRDGAGAVHSMCNVLERNGTQVPSESTVVFSICISSYLELRIHWRTRTADKTTWENRCIHKAFLDDPRAVFYTRLMIRNIISWAYGDRLKMVRATLAPAAGKSKSENKTPTVDCGMVEVLPNIR